MAGSSSRQLGLRGADLLRERKRPRAQRRSSPRTRCGRPRRRYRRRCVSARCRTTRSRRCSGPVSVWLELTALSAEQAERIRAELPTLRDRVLWGLQCAAGLRTEEALAVRWSDVLDLSPTGGPPAIDRVYVAGEFRQTKTCKGRDVPVIAPLAADLMDLRGRLTHRGSRGAGLPVGTGAPSTRTTGATGSSTRPPAPGSSWPCRTGPADLHQPADPRRGLPVNIAAGPGTAPVLWDTTPASSTGPTRPAAAAGGRPGGPGARSREFVPARSRHGR